MRHSIIRFLCQILLPFGLSDHTKGTTSDRVRNISLFLNHQTPTSDLFFISTSSTLSFFSLLYGHEFHCVLVCIRELESHDCFLFIGKENQQLRYNLSWTKNHLILKSQKYSFSHWISDVIYFVELLVVFVWCNYFANSLWIFS